MNLQFESSNWSHYLASCQNVQVEHEDIQQVAKSLCATSDNMIERIHKTFLFVRDEIDHSWDIQQTEVTQTAVDVLHKKHGICYAKSNLLAAFLRAQQVPTGFCYQRLMLFDTPEEGYCLHALNAVYIDILQRWIRLDSRGNKPGVDAQFSLEQERLAFRVDQTQGELDYPTVFVQPNRQTMETLANANNALEMYKTALPNAL